MGPDTRRHPGLLTRREAGTALLGVLALAGCGPVRPPRIALGGRGAATLIPALPRVDVVSGRPLITPVRVEGPLPGKTRPRITLAGGRTAEGALVWIGLRPDPVPTTTWLPTVDRWVVTPVTEGVIPASVGAWHVIVEMPPDAAGQSLRLGEHAVPVNWLPDPDALRPAGSDEAWEPWRTVPGAPEPEPGLLAPEWRSPLRRWRARLATTGLDGSAPARGVWQAEGDPAVLDQLSELTEARWRVGLARLWYADAEACRELVARLTRTAELLPGVRAPVWPVSQPVLDSLLGDLLDSDHTGEGLSLRARGWLGSLPAAAAWVADDAAGLLGATGEPLAQLRAVRLDEQPTMLWLAGREGRRVGEPSTLEPGVVGELAAAVGAGEPRTNAVGFTVRVGNASIALAARTAGAVRPPGASCAPLLHDWTLEAWQASDERAGALPDPAHAAAVLVYRDGSTPTPSGWLAYVECGGSGPGEDQVALYFGQRRASAAVLRLSSTGVLTDDRHPGEQRRCEIAQNSGRWSAVLPIPREAIEPNNILRVGATRRDPRGVRTAWPRRMMPWDTEPARAAFNLGTWSGLGGV